MSAFDSQSYPGNTEGKQISAPILDFRNRIGDLARPNLFQVEIGLERLFVFLQTDQDKSGCRMLT